MSAQNDLSLPELCLVVLVGASGSGKTTFAARHFGRYEVVSSDVCRGLVSNDENDQSASASAFELLGHIVGLRLTAGLLTVVDATNTTAAARKQLITLARSHDVLPVAIVLDVPVSVSVERNAVRPDRQFGAHVVRRHHGDLRRSLKSLRREGFRQVHVLNGVEEVESATVRRERLRNDLRHLHGPFDAIGDVHGCRAELEQLLVRLGYVIERDEEGRAVDAAHPEGRTAIFLGDLVDRGPDSPGVLRLAMGMHAAGHALVVPGNHENKLVKALAGRNVKVNHGLESTLEQLAAQPESFTAQVADWADALVSHLVLDDGRLVVAHAGLKEAYHGRTSGRVRSFALYGDTTGETDEYGLPVRYPWAREYRGRATVLYGHTPVPEAEWLNNTMCLDTGCVFGGKLSALRYPERELVDVAAQQVWYEPVRPLNPQPARGEIELDITDVLGRRVVEVAGHGPITVPAENSAAALEVLSRFALHPRRLAYLPPTMAPVHVSGRPDLLEHPDEAFAEYAKAGVPQVICEEKHMGSRAVVAVCRDADVAARRFGAAAGESGTIHTRTGRRFLAPDLTEQLLARLRAAIGKAGLWQELATDWLLLDAELLPWSVKAAGLLRDQYAAVGAAGRAALPAAVRELDRAAGRGLDVSALLERTRARRANVEAFTAAYGRYCWPVEGLDGVRLAPFQLLAGEGVTWHDRDHGWHLAVLDRLVAADPETFTGTRRLVVTVDDEVSRAEGVAWWQQLTEAGGEGMVVKPLANLAAGGRRLQPGVKVRGREYLRIIYGPDYTLPQHLSRLKQRNPGRKRSLALREYVLGLEALNRFAAGEPLWRVHEAVAGVLALESEPVDPRL